MNTRRAAGSGDGRRRHLPNSPFSREPEELPPPEVYAIGDQVTHDRHGLGTVTAVDGTAAVVVDFGTERRRVALPNPRLFRI